MSNDSALFCTRCGERLNPAKAVWLELDQSTDTYTKEPVADHISQGFFPFGSACSKRELKADAEVRASDLESANET